MNKTKIQWTDYTSNPIRFRDAEGKNTWACVKVSDGCAHCYAEELALSPRMVAPGRVLGAKFNAGNMGKLTPYVDPAEIASILRTTSASGKRCFLGDMTDIFGEWVPLKMLAQVFVAMALRPDVTFQVLTKRPERAREYVAAAHEGVLFEARLFEARLLEASESSGGVDRPRTKQDYRMNKGMMNLLDWPLPNVWLGTSVEDQRAADERIPELLETPAAVRFVSAEPLLGPVDLALGSNHRCDCGELRVNCGHRTISWVIVGGESGPNARPCNVEWIRDIVRQCQEAGVPVFCKQLGAKPSTRLGSDDWRGQVLSGHGRDEGDGVEPDWRWYPKLRDRKGGDPAEWPEDLRGRQFPEVRDA